MRLSILISVLNGERYLAEAMDSLLSQTYGDFELIVVDDGSTDRTPRLLAAYAAKDRRVRLLSQPNAGVAVAINAAARVARGDLFGRMDPDDVALPTRFERQVAFLNAHPDVDVLGTRVVLTDPYGTPIGHPQHDLTHEAIDARLLAGEGWAVVQPSAVVRRSAFEAVGGYDERFRTSQDFDLWLRLAERGRLANLPEPLLHYRQHLGSANFAKAGQQKLLKTKILTETYRRRGLPPFDPATLPQPPVTEPYESRRRWGWAAIRSKNFAAARRHAARNLLARPTAFEMWKLMYCTVRGH